MKKYILIQFIFLIGIIINCEAQDIIYKKDSTHIKCKVVKITDSEIDYYTFDNLDGPLYTIAVNQVVLIAFQNGTFKYFSTSSTPSSSQTGTTTQTGKDNTTHGFDNGSRIFPSDMTCKWRTSLLVGTTLLYATDNYGIGFTEEGDFRISKNIPLFFTDGFYFINGEAGGYTANPIFFYGYYAVGDVFNLSYRFNNRVKKGSYILIGAGVMYYYGYDNGDNYINNSDNGIPLYYDGIDPDIKFIGNTQLSSSGKVGLFYGAMFDFGQSDIGLYLSIGLSY